MRTLLFLVLMVVLIVGLTNIATIVERNNGIPNVLETLFPEKFVDKEAAVAAQTQMAPFAAAENAAQPVQIDPEGEIEYDPLAGSTVISQQLDMPHRHEAAVSEWVTEIMGQSLTFGLNNYDQHLQAIDTFMAANAMEEFQDFLQSVNVLALMNSRNFELKTFVTDIPKLATSGVAQGRYRWLYDVPINMTFLPLGMDSYEDLKPGQYVSETLTIRTQIGRVPEGGLEGMEIETWEVLPVRPQ